MSDLVALLMVYSLAPSCMTRVWYCSRLHIGQVFFPVNLSKACRHAFNGNNLRYKYYMYVVSKACRHTFNGINL